MKDGNHSAEVVGKLLRRKTITFSGRPLSPRDRSVMIVALDIQGQLLRDLLPCEDSWRSWCSFLGEMDLEVTRLSDTIKYLDSVIKLYASEYMSNQMSGHEDSVVRSVPGFKRQARDRKLYWSFVAPVESVLRDYFSHVDAGSGAILNQWANFLSHITLRDVDLRSSLVDEYIALEEREGNWAYDGNQLESMASIMEGWLHDFSLTGLVPSHGPGAVAELPGNTGRMAKYRVMSSDSLLLYWLRRVPDDLWYLTPPGGFDESRRLSRCSELICVPKSMTKNRTISKEPCSLQFFQHGVQRRVDEYMREHPVLSGRIDLHDQDSSKELARRGSVRGEWDTVDLSAASDSITTRLVKAVFARTPLYRSLVCLRSQRTLLPTGQEILLNKFAPMGSDLCFPTMCLVFACVCEQAVRNVAGRASRLNEYRVYGDDIVIRHSFTSELMRLLAALHFEVNERKSFTELSFHNFREACGGEYLDGIEITPVRVSRRLRTDDLQGTTVSSVEGVSSFVELANSFFERGMFHARVATLANLKGLFPEYGKLPYTAEVCGSTVRYGRSTYVLPTYSTAILTHAWCCTNYRNPSRYSGSLGRAGVHRRQFFVLTPKAAVQAPYELSARVVEPDVVRYYEYWLTLPDRPYVTEFGVQYAPEPVSGLYPLRPTWRRKWVSALR